MFLAFPFLFLAGRFGTIVRLDYASSYQIIHPVPASLAFPAPCHAYIRADKDGKIIIEYVLVTLRIMAWSFYSTHGLRKMDLVEQQSSQVYTCMLERLYSRSLKLRFSFYVKSYTSLRRQFAFGILLVWAC
jgi:hypothetical protein